MNRNAYHMPNILVVDYDKEDCLFFTEAIKSVAPRANVFFLEVNEPLSELIERVKPSLIFIEYKLPWESGVELVQQLKSHPVYHSIPVIMWSTGSIELFMKKAYDAGVQLYLEKPWDMEIWQERVKTALEQYPKSYPLQPAGRIRTTVFMDTPRIT